MATSNPVVLIVTILAKGDTLHMKAHSSQVMAAAQRPRHQLSCLESSSQTSQGGKGERTSSPKEPRSRCGFPIELGTLPNTQSCSPWRVGSLTPGQPLPASEKALQPNLSISCKGSWSRYCLVWGKREGQQLSTKFPNSTLQEDAEIQLNILYPEKVNPTLQQERQGPLPSGPHSTSTPQHGPC